MSLTSWDSFIDVAKKCMTAAGDGVHTVSTGNIRKINFQEKFYKSNESWHKNIEKISENSNKTIIIGAPTDTGAAIQRGSNWGPLILRDQLLSDNISNFNDIGDIKVIPHLLHDKYLNQQTLESCRKFLYETTNGPDLPVSPLSILEFVTKNIYNHNTNAKILTIGGDHSISYPLIKEFIKKSERKNKKIAIIHFDAHTDLSDNRMGIDICFGTWANKIVKDLDKSHEFIQVGIRASNFDKAHWESKFNVSQFWANDIKTDGLNTVISRIKDKLSKKEIDEVYISLDIDSIDSDYVSATGTPESNGLAPHEVTSIIKSISKSFPITSADIVEFAPFVQFDPSNNSGLENTLLVTTSCAKILISLLNKS